MTTVNGLFTAGDGTGASGHKFSSGSHAEGRQVAKSMFRFVGDNKDFKPTLKESPKDLADYRLQAGKDLHGALPEVNVM